MLHTMLLVLELTSTTTPSRSQYSRHHHRASLQKPRTIDGSHIAEPLKIARADKDDTAAQRWAADCKRLTTLELELRKFGLMLRRRSGWWRCGSISMRSCNHCLSGMKRTLRNWNRRLSAANALKS
ncbi:hypothetical protein BJ742DRAFT_766327 [Cladochytrium replicatum]|nr:hypothetical protein BJ742DRAFT_766327 [Cladochytrium replicatum]